MRAEIWDPVPTSDIISTLSTTSATSLAWPSSHTKGSGLWYLGSATGLLVLSNIPGSPPLGCAYWERGWRHLLTPPISIKRGAWTLMSAISPTLTLKTFDLIMVMSFTITSIIAFAPHIILISIFISCIAQWQRIAAFGSLWPLNYHLQLSSMFSQIHDVIPSNWASLTHRLPTQAWPPTQTQPFRLLSQVEGTLSLVHHTSSARNHASACEVHEKDDLSGASGFHLHSTS